MYGVNNISKTINSVLYSTNENLSGAGDLYIVRDLRIRARKEPGQTVSNKDSGLSGYGDKYTVIDNRKRAKKEPGELIANKNISFRKKGKAAENYNKDAYDDSKYKRVVIVTNLDGLFIEFYIFKAITKATENTKSEPGFSIKQGADGKYYKGTPDREIVKANIKDLYNIVDYIPSKKEAYVTNEIYKKYYNNALEQFFDDLKRTIKYYEDELEKNKNNTYKYNSNKFVQQSESYLKEAQKVYNYNIAFYNYNYDGLGKPTIKFEFENNDELKNFLKENKDNLIDSEVEDAEIVEDEPDFSRKSLRGFQDGKPASIFNCPESNLVCKGFVPTYKKLESYNHLIDDATGENLLVGYGFDKTTKELLIDTVNKYYKQVYKLAEHLKADTVAQTCFNIWHWEHCNLKYNYDSPGKEEIRTPARTWKDRFNGIDCDCLAVFTASILKCLGFPADFEIVAFNGSDKYAHIFITCAGVVIDRVLPIFNQRAPLITKTLKMQIPVYSLNGLSGSDKAVIALSGLYSSTLSKIFSHTATADDVINHRKTQLLLNLADKDNNGYRFAVILMPFVKAIDDSGAFYFDNSKIADIAKKGEAEIISLERRNATEAELSGLFKKIGKAIKNAAKSVGNAVKTVAKGTVKAATSVVKSTANVVKSSANLVKAGVQAATGSKSAAKSTLRKAVSQAKSAVVNPVKTSVSVTKNVVKATVVEPTKTAVKDTIDITKETVKIAGKLFKVILIKINPATILIRNSLRLLIAINFLGLATRLNVANMTESEAAKVGVSAAQYKEAKTAYDRVVRFFVKWGGKKENIERAIRNGAKRKALFKKDYNKNSKIVETGEDEATLSGTAPILCGISGLGEGVTIASALAAVGAFIAKIWGWVKNIVVKVANVAGNVKDKFTQFTGGNSNSNGETANPEDSNIVVVTETEENNNNNKWLVPALVGGGLLTLLLTSGGRKKK